MILLSIRDKAKGYRGFDLSLEKDHQLRMEIAGEDPDLPADKRVGYSPHLISVLTTTNVNPTLRPEWHHVLVGYDGSRKAEGVRIFLDGKKQPTTVLYDKLLGTMKSSVPLHLGSRHGGYRFRGSLDDVRVYNRRLSETEVQQLYDHGIHASVQRLAGERSVEQQKLLDACCRSQDEPSQRLAKELRAARLALHTFRTDHLSHNWYVNSQGQTMVVIPGPVTFLMGAPPTEERTFDYETQHKKRIGRTFALAAKAVTIEQYRRFDKDYELQAVYTRKADLPVAKTSWHDAAEYCNWLSKEEGIEEDQRCYEIKNGQVIRLKANYLSLTGYRLPTESEMEYATRAGALTNRYYGETDDLLPNYAWYLKNSQEKTWPVGSLKPNDFGLFDMQGNVFSWCQDRLMDYPSNQGEEIEDTKDIFRIDDQDYRILRGGSFYYHASIVRSSFRGSSGPASRNGNYGFRPARTFTP
jgi:formylglycine-generating enzyme required for sulfatase activity